MWKVTSECNLEPQLAQHHPEWLVRYIRQPEQVEPVIQFWVNWIHTRNEVPPGLITLNGVLIDGNHRYEACRRLDRTMWCIIVELHNGLWIATGGVRLIRT